MFYMTKSQGIDLAESTLLACCNAQAGGTVNGKIWHGTKIHHKVIGYFSVFCLQNVCLVGMTFNWKPDSACFQILEIFKYFCLVKFIN